MIEGKVRHPPKVKVDLLAQGLVQISYEGGNRVLPKVMLEDKYFQELCNPWKEALVINFLGKTVGYYVLKERLKKLWKTTEGHIWQSLIC